MGRPWWYDSYWEKQNRSRGKRKITREPGNHSSATGCIFVFVISFILIICGLFVWILYGNQIANFVNDLSYNTSPVTNEPPSHITPSPAPESVKPQPAAVTTPEPVKPTEYEYGELVQHALELINRDRLANGLMPVILGDNKAAQRHAEERLANRYGSHWGMDGMKPYMRHTLAGGENYEAENGFMTDTIWIRGKDPSYIRDPVEMLEQAQQGLMTSPGHRKNILDKWHRKVNLGIAYDKERLDLVQQFEGDYLDFLVTPVISGDILWMSGEVNIGTIENVTIYYDPLPEPLTPEQLDSPPYDYAYELGEKVGLIVPPPPPGHFYTDLSSYAVIASKWEVEPSGFFDIEVDMGEIIDLGDGVYTVVIWSNVNDEFVALSNYSIFLNQ